MDLRRNIKTLMVFLVKATFTSSLAMWLGGCSASKEPADRPFYYTLRVTRGRTKGADEIRFISVDKNGRATVSIFRQRYMASVGHIFVNEDGYYSQYSLVGVDSDLRAITVQAEGREFVRQ